MINNINLFEPKMTNRFVANIKDIPSFIIFHVNKPVANFINGECIK